MTVQCRKGNSTQFDPRKLRTTKSVPASACMNTISICLDFVVNYAYCNLTFHPLVATRRSTTSDGCQIDTNIFVLKFNSLSEPKPVHTGDPVICSNQACTAVLNHLSYIREEEEMDKKV